MIGAVKNAPEFLFTLPQDVFGNGAIFFGKKMLTGHEKKQKSDEKYQDT